MWLQQGKHICMKIASLIWLRNETLEEPASQKKLYMIYCMYMYVIFVLSKLWKLPLCLNSVIIMHSVWFPYGCLLFHCRQEHLKIYERADFDFPVEMTDTYIYIYKPCLFTEKWRPQTSEWNSKKKWNNNKWNS